MIKLEGHPLHLTALEQTVGRYADNPDRFVSPRQLFGNIIPYFLDNFPFPVVSANLEADTSHLTKLIFSKDLTDHLLEMASPWPKGAAKGAVLTIGTPQTGSAHPHLYELMRTPEGVRLLFVDPEDTVGARNPVKPALINLCAAEITQTDIHFVYVRFRSSSLVTRDTHLSKQYFVAEQLLETDGRPQIVPESDVLFRLSLKPNQAQIDSRFVPPWQTSNFLQTGTGAFLIECRFSELKDQMDYFIPALNQTGHSPQVYESVMRNIR